MSDESSDRAELSRNVTIAAIAAPSAAVVYFIFHAVFENITTTAKAVGQIDSATTMGLAMGWIVMVGGSGVLAVIAVVAAIRALRIWSRMRRAA